MDNKSAYKALMMFGGTPVRCRSYNEVKQFIEGLCEIYPSQSDMLKARIKVFGCNGYESEVVFLITESTVSPDRVAIGFCTADYYRRKGYVIAEFSEAFPVDFGDIQVEHLDLSVLFGT